MQHDPKCAGSRKAAVWVNSASYPAALYEKVPIGALPAPAPTTDSIIDTVRKFMECRPDAHGRPMAGKLLESESFQGNWVRFWIMPREDANDMHHAQFRNAFHGSSFECL